MEFREIYYTNDISKGGRIHKIEVRSREMEFLSFHSESLAEDSEKLPT